MNWIPCEKELPDVTEDEVVCLVTCQEWDLFDSKWGNKEVRVLSYSIKNEKWNTKSDIRVLAWMPLPLPYEK